jgi:anti-sigma factor RsiW
MCDFSGKLIAWLDHELPPEEAAEVEGHLEVCSECRSGVDAYKRVSGEFDAYCDAAIASSARRGVPSWVPVVLGAGAVAALVTLFLAMPRTRVEPPALHRPQTVVAASPVIVTNVLPASVSTAQRVHRRQAVTRASIRNANIAPVQSQDANVLPDEPMIQIAIPADEMFPPGAVPEGMHFVADLSIAADGSAERLRLRPRLAGYERRTTQP